MPEMTDLYGLPVSGADAAALQGIDDFVHGFISFQTKAANVLAAAEAAPSCALVNAYAAILYMLLEAPVAPQLAAPFLKAAEAAAQNATPREQATVNAARLFHDGKVPELIALCEETIRRYPRDMVMLKLGQYHTFNIGDFPAMLRIATRAFPGADDIAYAHGMLAFGYEECHLLDQAEAAARRAMELRPDEPWAHHALAHIYLTRGDVAGGTVFLESVADTWRDLNSFMRSHNWWHLALFYISQGRHADVLRAYDENIWGLSKDYSQDQVSAVSLLARLDFAGVDVGDRWADVVDHVAQRGADTVSPFLTLQYLYALGRTDDRRALGVMMDAIEARAADATKHDHRAWAEVALPAARGIVAHANRNWSEAARLMGAALPRLAECGGSHAQRDLFDQIHLDALMENGDVARAQQVLEMRRTYDPDGVPLNRMLAEVYTRNGLPELAAQARARTAAASGA
ncbi:tetratricopeptide repeat protein [Pseudosulfitobacter koreensis]|uniref:Tetratricopeptide repeat protein 38 n=1 Tax=Pseudosulfitobacter koreensis TaxID=2968472 RepID=A0ABT1YX93_9RHOB|nr:tetratricopeptide repeat protein [Pseudosulfitobacter koreense]MCR8825508.1 tetratricopeptide repeat protein [Pseudosulfitobacter koreense]